MCWKLSDKDGDYVWCKDGEWMIYEIEDIQFNRLSREDYAYTVEERLRIDELTAMHHQHELEVLDQLEEIRERYK